MTNSGRKITKVLVVIKTEIRKQKKEREPLTKNQKSLLEARDIVLSNESSHNSKK